MRALGLVGLLLALLIVGLLVKKQMGGAAVAPGAPAPVATPAQQVEQFKQSLDKAMQRPPMPDDAKP